LQASSQEIAMTTIATATRPGLRTGLAAAALCAGLLLSACAGGPAAQMDGGKPVPAALKPADS
jgi:hypothetical protein